MWQLATIAAIYKPLAHEREGDRDHPRGCAAPELNYCPGCKDKPDQVTDLARYSVPISVTAVTPPKSGVVAKALDVPLDFESCKTRVRYAAAGSLAYDQRRRNVRGAFVCEGCEGETYRVD